MEKQKRLGRLAKLEKTLTKIELIATVGRPSLQAFGDGASTTLKCTHLDVNVEITGVFSKTTFEMTFYNETQQILSGELTFPLPEGAVVSGFGLDVDGKIVDGVVVEKKKARIAFETEMRKNIDPGLIEKVQGNNFKTRGLHFSFCIKTKKCIQFYPRVLER